MLKKEEFVKFIYEIRDLNDLGDEINECVRKYEEKSKEYLFGSSFVTSNETSMIRLIAKLLSTPKRDEKIVDDEISWWCYETDFGRCEKSYKTITFEDGKKIEINTAEDLYDYILNI